MNGLVCFQINTRVACVDRSVSLVIERERDKLSTIILVIIIEFVKIES